MAEPISTPLLYYHPDAYDLAHGRLMGRQSASHGFLRALVAGRGDGEIVGSHPDPSHRAGFEGLVGRIDPAAPVRWVSAQAAPAEMGRMRVLHRADPVLSAEARARLRAGPAAYCLTGVTHTLASSGILEAIAAMLTEPFEAWDAVICTSRSAAEIARRIHEAQSDFLRWRLGPDVRLAGPQLPVIPLGVHVDDFSNTRDVRAAARQAFGFGDDDVVVLYVGRLTFHSKAHPYPMLAALQAIAERGGAMPALAFYGQALNAPVAEAFRAAAREYAPDVKTVFIDGASVDAIKAWACGDIFCSLADGIQETFGLTPVEAMACGLPCVVTDWNGYRETVRDGVDGFCAPTWAPGPGAGTEIAKAYEAGSLEYNLYTWATTVSTFVDIPRLIEHLSALIENPQLRKSMGASGAVRAREVYDWRKVYRDYQALWEELDARRLHALADPGERARLQAAPRAAASHPDPFALFSHYPSALLTPATRVRVVAGRSVEDLAHLAPAAMFRNNAVGTAALTAMWSQLWAGAATAQEAAGALECEIGLAVRALGVLAKMGLIELMGD